VPAKLTDECGRCGMPAPPQTKLCLECWQDVCGEIQDRVVWCFNHDGYHSERFRHAVEDAVRFLLWKDGELD